MARNRRISLVIVSLLLLVAALAMPMTASAGPPRVERDSAKVFVQPDEGATLEAGGIVVTIPEGAMPEGGQVVMHVRWIDGVWFRLDLLPHRQFDEFVKIDFGPFGAAEIYFDGPGGLVRIYPVGGVYETDHFSRYSGWY